MSLKHYCIEAKVANEGVLHRRFVDEKEATGAAPRIEPNSVNGPYFTPVEVARLYGFPEGVDGAGQKIGIINLGGGYRPADIQAYLTSIGVSANPSIVDVFVNGGVNNPDDDSGASYEVGLDLSIVAAVAPGAEIRMYFAPNSFKDFVDAVIAAVNDGVHVLSISWGLSERQWPSLSRNEMNAVFQSASKNGVAIFCAAGDYGASNGSSGLNVDFPGSSPAVISCGGTTVVVSNGSITSEVAWGTSPSSATGGGISRFYNKPEYQRNVPLLNGKTRRGLPDIAANADPESGYIVRVLGQDVVIGGTSAVSPLLSALTALVNHKRSLAGKPSVGALNDDLYGAPLSVFRDITDGGNFGYNAASGWDFTTGLGAPSKELSDHLIGSGGGGSVVEPVTPIQPIQPNVVTGFNMTPTTVSYNQAITCTPVGTQEPGTSYTWTLPRGKWVYNDEDIDSTGNGFVFGYSIPAFYLSTDSDINPSVTYQFDNNGSSIQTLSFDGKPVVDFDGSILQIPTASFFSKSTTSRLSSSYQWSVNGVTQSSTTSTMSFSPPSTGTYNIGLTVTNNAASPPLSTSLTKSFEITAAGAAFVPTLSSNFAPSTVSFSNNTVDNGVGSYLWDFGNGTTSTLKTPSNVTYSTAGKYTVVLTYTDPSNVKSVAKAELTIQNPNVNASFTKQASTSYSSIGFYNFSTGPSNTKYLWDFGNGITSTLKQPGQITFNSGTFTVSLTATNDLVTPALTSTATTTVEILDATVTANFTITPSSGSAPLAVTLNPSGSLGPISSYAWTFGDGTSASTTTAVNQIKTYNTPGTYNITLTVTSVNATSYLNNSKTIALTVGNPASAPTCSFIGGPYSGTIPLNCAFTDTSSPNNSNITAWSWNMGEPGNPQNIQTTQNASITYTFAGSKVVSLTVTNGIGSSSCTQTVMGTSTVTPPGSAFTISGARVPNQALTFTYSPSPNPPANPTGYLWNFGNGFTNSSGPTVSYAYPTTGTYTASLQVTNYGGRSTSSQTVTITVASLTVVFNTTPAFTAATRTLTINAGTSVTCTNTTVIKSGTTANFVWSYGSGSWGSYPSASTSGLTAPPALVYNVPGTYTLSCSGTQSDGATGQSTITVVVNATTAAVSNFSMTLPNSPTPTTVVTTVNRGVTFQLNQLSTNFPSSFTWNYNGAVDAVTGTAPSTALRVPPPLKFPTTSTVTPVPITLTVSNSKNTTASVKTISYKVKGPLADVSWVMNKVVYKYTATLSSSANTTLLTWDFKDGSPLLTGTKSAIGLVVNRGFFTTPNAGQFLPSLLVRDSSTDAAGKTFTLGTAISSVNFVAPALTITPRVALPENAGAASREARPRPSLEDRRALKLAKREEKALERQARRESKQAEEGSQMLPRYTGTVSFTAAVVADTTSAYLRQFIATVVPNASGTPTYAWKCTKVGTTTSVSATVQNPVITFTSSGNWSCSLTVTTTNGARTVTGVVAIP